MILADKIIKLRKKNGWSQEELAAKLEVSRQAVSKWESAQAIPDIDRILQLGRLFGVTTDYLLKDEMEDEEPAEIDEGNSKRRISLEEANAYIETRRWTSFRIAFATYLCILSPIVLILLGAASDIWRKTVSEGVVAIVGLVTLFLCVISAVAIFIYCGFKNDAYEFLDKNVPFELEYGVSGIIKEKQKEYRQKYIKSNIMATCLCIISPLPLIASSFTESEFFIAVNVCLLLVIAGAGVSLFIVAGVQNSAMQKLLCEGEYAPDNKEKSRLTEAVESAYWGLIVAGYLGWSFLSGDWHITWVVFVIGGVLSPVVNLICKSIKNKQDL